MGLYENWPSANLHAINLDYYLKQVKRVSEDIAIINSWKDELTGRVDHVEEIVADLNENVQELNNLYNTFVDTVNARFDELSASVDKRIADLSKAIQKELDRKIKEIDDKLVAFSAEINDRLDGQDKKIAQLRKDFEKIITDIPSVIQMYNPFVGYLTPIQDIILKLISFHRENALTAGEYDALQLTATAYDTLQVTAYNYDFDGKTYVHN